MLNRLKSIWRYRSVCLPAKHQNSILGTEAHRAVSLATIKFLYLFFFSINLWFQNGGLDPWRLTRGFCERSQFLGARNQRTRLIDSASFKSIWFVLKGPSDINRLLGQVESHTEKSESGDKSIFGPAGPLYCFYILFKSVGALARADDSIMIVLPLWRKC